MRDETPHSFPFCDEDTFPFVLEDDRLYFSRDVITCQSCVIYGRSKSLA